MFCGKNVKKAIKIRKRGLMMTIYETSKEIIDLVNKHHVRGAECIINALVESTVNKPYLDEDSIVKMVHKAFKLMGDSK